MDEIDLLKEFSPGPEEPEAQVLHTARNALVRRAAGRPPFLAVLAGGRRYRALAPALAVAAVAAVVSGAALIGKIPDGTPAAGPSASAPASPSASASATRTGPNLPPELATLAEQAATRAEQRTIPAGEYWHTRWTDGTEVRETWRPADPHGTWYFRGGDGAVTTAPGDDLWGGQPFTELTQGPRQFVDEFRGNSATAFATLDDFLVGPEYGLKLTNQQRATAYRAAVLIHGVGVLDKVNTHAGVTGMGFNYGDTTIVVDPDTGDVVGANTPQGPIDITGSTTSSHP